MSEFKGTKGKWTSKQTVLNTQLQSNFTVTTDKRYVHTPIAQCFSETMNLTEAKANSTLISYAPELLEALKLSLELLQLCECPESLIETYGNALMNYGELIKKATEL